jgi:hypothetical protein
MFLPKEGHPQKECPERKGGTWVQRSILDSIF